MDGKTGSDIHPGSRVRAVQKEHHRPGGLTEGVVQDILTSSPHHPHGIKVRIQRGAAGRVREGVWDSRLLP